VDASRNGDVSQSPDKKQRAQPNQLSGQAALAWELTQMQNKKCQEFLADSTNPCKVSMWGG
jgi:hypothetical protein